jgi:hypothetical protein
MIKPWLDPETVTKISIQHSLNMSYFEKLHISKEDLPHWCGGSALSIPILSIIKRHIEEQGHHHHPPSTNSLSPHGLSKSTLEKIRLLSSESHHVERSRHNDDDDDNDHVGYVSHDRSGDSSRRSLYPNEGAPISLDDNSLRPTPLEDLLSESLGSIPAHHHHQRHHQEYASQHRSRSQLGNSSLFTTDSGAMKALLYLSCVVACAAFVVHVHVFFSGFSGC